MNGRDYALVIFAFVVGMFFGYRLDHMPTPDAPRGGQGGSATVTANGQTIVSPGRPGNAGGQGGTGGIVITGRQCQLDNLCDGHGGMESFSMTCADRSGYGHSIGRPEPKAEEDYE